MDPLSNAGYLTYPTEKTIHELPIDQHLLLALAYWRHQRRQVVDVGLSMLGSWSGRHRSGKSVSASTAGYLMDPTFWTNYEERVVKDHREFMDAWERIDRKKIYGAVVQVDEAGVSMASSDWYEAWIKDISKMVQMFGYLRPVVFFCAPIKDFVDNRLRRMFQNYFEVKRFTKTYCVYRPYDVSFNAFKNKAIYKTPKISIMDRDIYIHRIVTTPPQCIIDAYREIEERRKPEQLRGFKEDMQKQEAARQKREVDPNKAIDYVVKHYKMFEGERSKPDSPTINSVHISFFFKVPTRTAQYIANMAKQRLRAQYKLKMEGGTHEDNKAEDNKQGVGNRN